MDVFLLNRVDAGDDWNNYVQVVQSKAVPLGNETGMTDEERDALGRWIKAQQ